MKVARVVPIQGARKLNDIRTTHDSIHSYVLITATARAMINMSSRPAKLLRTKVVQMMVLD
jgi:hypothetical protein